VDPEVQAITELVSESGPESCAGIREAFPAVKGRDDIISALSVVFWKYAVGVVLGSPMLDMPFSRPLIAFCAPTRKLGDPNESGAGAGNTSTEKPSVLPSPVSDY